MSDDSTSDRDDARLAQLLRATGGDLPVPDLAWLQQLRVRSADTFVGAERIGAGAGESDELAPAPPSTRSSSPATPRVRRSRRIVPVLLGAATTAAAAVVVSVVWIISGGLHPVSAAPAFSSILDQLRKAQTIELQVVKAGSTARIWVRAPGLVRRQRTPDQYDIAAGSRLWTINETTNEVTERDSPWFVDPQHPVDLLGLLEVGVTDASALLEAVPIDRARLAGRDCFVYRVAVPAEQGRLQIEALADASDLELVQIVAWPEGVQRGAGPPLAELRLIAVNVAVDDDKFVVAKSLTEDGRIGKVTEAQGIVLLRPMLAKRWTPVCRPMLLKPGDWIRTERRGAHAAKVTLSSEVELTLGPGTLLECVSPAQARLHTGEVQVAMPELPGAGPEPAADESALNFEVLAPRAGSRKFQRGDLQLVRVDRSERLVDVGRKPIWLEGFEGTSSNESLGSLIVNLPDGRNEPLTVGYHKVSVEIRDQIARTTIEESFVNHTPNRLEGVVHFPLPQDASISGFGMWIGNDLVEADVVEKQRAREIYETILREKRDPGLLEWTGGNIYKARVFPIEPQSEKRIKIVYTQVLPLRANRYRYSYGLRSELLRTHPLRELSLTVTVNSALPLKSVACPTHPVRAQQTAHSAQLEFTAQEYSPDRDFEVVCEIDGRQSDVVVVPHRRGDDGYFLVQLTPPGPEGNWQRELLRDGQPLNIALLCDTSASMDGDKRAQQFDFVATMLSSLGPDDRFLLGCADVATHWIFAAPQVASEENVARAKTFLEERLSLGWTDLDRAFQETLQKSPPDAQIIYIGDGIVSAGDTDPAAFVTRLGLLLESNGHAGGSPRRTFHAVTVGNSYESIVLKGIATVGGGSMRAIGGQNTPQTVALELISELSQPGLRDVNVEFRGLKVAAVYPEPLPNVPAGTQQILVGRYLPEGGDQQGEVVVTGKLGNQTVRYAARVNLKDAESGNSFIPRLWARAHLDHLLAQGQSDVIRDQIIALSEQYHIITPYTSLLVLESDADRERFGVTRRYAMRDGERFFAQGRDNANWELLQAQMKRASDWRLGLRRQVLGSLQRLGRVPLDAQRRYASSKTLDEWRGRWGGIAGPAASYSASGPVNYPTNLSLIIGPDAAAPYSESARLGETWYGGYGDYDTLAEDLLTVGEEVAGVSLGATGYEMLPQLERGELLGRQLGLALRDYTESSLDEMESSVPLFDTSFSMDGKYALDRDASFAFGAPVSRSYRGIELRKNEYSFLSDGIANANTYFALSGLRRSRSPDYASWFNMLFAPVPPRPIQPQQPVPEPATWSPEAIALAKSLYRVDSLRALTGGIQLRRVSEMFDPRWNRRWSRGSDLVLYSPRAWLTRPLGPADHTVVHHCNEEQRAAYSLAFLLGQTRVSTEHDLALPPFRLDDFSLTLLHQTYANSVAHVEPAGDHRVKLILTWKDSENAEHLTIDTQRHVVVKHEMFTKAGQPRFTTVYDDFVEAAGSWWARKSTRYDHKQRKVAETTLDLQVLETDQFSQRLNAELAATPHVQFVRVPLVKLSVARQKVADGSADFNDRLAMILYSASIQQWDELWKHVDAAEQLATGKPGVRWMRTMIQIAIRRNEEARQRLLEEARQLVAQAQQDELYLADFILDSSYALTSWPEFLELVNLLKPVYQRQPAELEVMPRWQERLARCFDGLGRVDEALEVRRARADAAPWQLDWQIEYARQLMSAGHADAAFKRLDAELNRTVERTAHEDESLRSAIADLYRAQARWSDLLAFTTQWIATRPEYESAYAQHLSALVFNDQLDAANALTEQWLNESRIDGRLAPDQRARLEAAIRFAAADGYNLSFRHMDPRWVDAIGQTIRFFIRHRYHSDIGTRGIGGSFFPNSDVADQLRGEFLGWLRTDLAQLTATQIRALIDWTTSGRIELREPIAGRTQLDASEIPDQIWKQIADQLKSRWAASPDKAEKHSLGQSLHTIYANRFADSELLPFLRERLADAAPEYRHDYLSSLLDALLSAPWSEAIEQEVFHRLRQLGDPEQPLERFALQVPALQRAVDQMLANRQSSAERKWKDQGEQNKWTRRELAEKNAEMLAEARKGVSDRLATEAEKETGPLVDWLRIEQAWLDVQLDRNLDQVEALCWQILGEAPPRPVRDDETHGDELSAAEMAKRQFDAILKQRALTTVMHLAARRNARPETVDHVLQFLDAGIALGGEAARPWRLAKFNLLIALDRPDELERQLREWIRADVSTAPWRQQLGRLMAERGKLDEAIPLFEAAEKDKLLSAADYASLADWYLAVNRREDYERARIEAFKQLPERQLANMIYHVRNRWYRTDAPLPSELDENTLFAFRALFEKSGRPEGYLGQLRDVYAACRDFRLLEMLPDAMLGRSPQQVYSFLQNVESQVLHELRNEATADQILSRIERLRDGQRTSTDLRALDLLEAAVERKSSEVLNQPGPHLDACLAALRRAFEREWTEGEPRMMATLLRQLGTLSQPPLADEQLRQLRALQQTVPAATRDHLYITHDLCHLLFWSYGKRDETLRELENEVHTYRQAHDGTWPHEDNDALGDYVAMHEQLGRHAGGESVLKNQLEQPIHDEQRQWLRDRLLSLYNDALEHGSEVSLGKGNMLFRNLVALQMQDLEAASDDNVRHAVVSRIVATLDHARRHKIPGAEEAVRRFAFQTMPAVLTRQQARYRDTVVAPLSVIARTLGPKSAWQYVVERMEQYPQRLEFSWESSWRVFGHELARLHQETGKAKLDPGDLEPRTLALAVEALKREIRTGDRDNPYIYRRDHDYFWEAQAGEFARAAEEVLAERRGAGRRAQAVADYLWHGLRLYPRSLEILLLAHQDGLLDQQAQATLVDRLQEQNRHAESIAILQPLVSAHPDTMRYHTQLMIAYHRSQRPEQLGNLIDQTHAHFHQGGRWSEGNITELAHGCYACEDWQRAIGYFEEAIALHQRTVGSQGLNDGALWELYRHVALAQAALGRTREAVDAASASIVSWDTRHERRRIALDTLQQVLHAAKDLDAYVQHLDEQAEATGQDSPLIRKAVGKTYQNRKQYAKAIAQCQVAVQLQPNDADVHQALIACYDALEDKQAATRQLLKLIDLKPHDLELYQQLAERLKDDEAESERAATSIIEASPNEAENHAAMAELRQKQNRWTEAIRHWQQVAKLRRLEPTGLLKLAEAQLHEKQWDAARATIAQLQRTEWPARFTEVPDETQRLMSHLPRP